MPKNKNKAFTLVELAIVITIIGLLIGGVLKGQELLEASRMTSLVSQLKSYEAALTTFNDIYKGKPGDLAGAANFITGCTSANNCVNGNGNGIIGSNTFSWVRYYANQECFQAWKQMALAGLITGVDTTLAFPASFDGGKHVPTSPFGGQLYLKTSVTVDPTGSEMTGTVTYLADTKTGGWGTSTNFMKPSTAMKIDLKIDDGKAFSGDTKTISAGWTSGCGTTTNGPNGYNVNSTGRCDIGFNIAQ